MRETPLREVEKFGRQSKLGDAFDSYVTSRRVHDPGAGPNRNSSYATDARTMVGEVLDLAPDEVDKVSDMHAHALVGG